jgi:Bacterial PH domain
MNSESSETVLRREHLHSGIFGLPALVLALCLVPVSSLYFTLMYFGKAVGFMPISTTAFGLILVVFLSPALIVLGLVWVAYLKTEITLTTKRLAFQTGLIVRASGELPLENVEGTFVVEPLFGRLFGYGTIIVTGLGGTQYPLRFIGSPREFHVALQQAMQTAKAPPRPTASQPLPDDDSRYMPKG